MKIFVALGKVQVCILCILCILQANFLLAAPSLNISVHLSKTQEDGVQPVDGDCTCGDGSPYPVDTNKLWKDNCLDIDGKSYQAGQYLTSCSCCLKFICRLKVENEDPECEKYGWEKLLEDTCCQDCNGKVFPAGAVMKEHKLLDKCATTLTTTCAFIRGGTAATIWESSSYEKCCINSEGVQLLNTTKLVPKLCSVRICLSQSGKHEPSYALIKKAKGCNCCEYESKLYADGTWKIIQGQNATCCLGGWRVELQKITASTTEPPATCFKEDTNIRFRDLGKNRHGQDQVPEWMISDGGKTLSQQLNTRPSVGVTNLGLPKQPVQFSGRVYSNSSDNDVIGMVFGYQDETNFFVVASDNNPPGPMNWYVGRLHATCGVFCADETTISDAIWDPLHHPQEITVLANGTQHWEYPKVYKFSICFIPSELLISVNVTVEGGEQVLHSGTISAATENENVNEMLRNGGHIGVYVDSQQNTTWDQLNCDDCTIFNN